MDLASAKIWAVGIMDGFAQDRLRKGGNPGQPRSCVSGLYPMLASCANWSLLVLRSGLLESWMVLLKTDCEKEAISSIHSSLVAVLVVSIQCLSHMPATEPLNLLHESLVPCVPSVNQSKNAMKQGILEQV